MTNSNDTAGQELRKRTRRDFLALGIAGLAGVAGWEWLQSRPDADGIPEPFRRMLAFNKRVTSGALFSDQHLAPSFPVSAAREIKPNGDEGLDDDVDMQTWRLRVTHYRAQDAGLELKMEDIYRLPKIEQTTEFKCIEGWSVVVNWAGARFSDFTAKYARGSDSARYAGLETPDKKYFVGLDMPSALHPQTLLCYEKNGKPLEAEHGAPLRLIIPVKYGIKNIKRIGQIRYSDDPPEDYWAKEGYDYYAGL